MAREIKRTRRMSTVSPSGTAARMGVVDVYTPDVSKIFNIAGDTMNTLAENQIKILDTKWQNNFEIETTKYLNDKVNNILQSGEKPDLTKFQEETDGYINGVLANVPERLSIGAESYYNQKNLNAFEQLRKQANIMEYNEQVSLYETNIKSNLDNIDSYINNNTITAQSPQDFLNGLDQFFATEVTAFLGKHSDMYDSLIPGSQNKLNEATKQKKEQELLLSIEGKRVNAVIKSFYQNIDVKNKAEVDAANEQAQLFLRNYALNEGGVRGVNYDVFKDETGADISQDTIDSIISSGIGEYNRIKSLNDFGLTEVKRKKMTEDTLAINTLDKSISDVTKPILNQNNLFTQLINNQEVPASPEVIRQYLDSEGIMYNPSDITNLYNKNLAAFNLRNNLSNANEDFSLREVLSSKENQKYLDTLGTDTDSVIQQKLNDIANYYGIEDSLKGYLSLGEGDEGVANVLYSFMRDNQILSFGAEQLFKQINTGRMIDLLDRDDKESIDKWFDEVLPQWSSLTNDGAVKFENLSKETGDMFSFFNDMKQYYEPIDIARKWKNVVENRASTKAEDMIEQSAAFKSWYKNFEDVENRSVTADYINKYRKDRNEYKIYNDSFVGFEFKFLELFGFGDEPTGGSLEKLVETEEEILSKFDPDYIKNLDSMVEMEAIRLTTIDTQGEQDPNVINHIFNANVFKVMENLIKEQDYGVTRFAPNSGDKFVFYKDAMEKKHGLDENTAINYVSAFVNTYIKQNYDTDPDLRNAFKDMDDVEFRPTYEQIYKMAESGVFELMRVEGTDNYSVKLNLDNAGFLGISPYSYADDTIEIKVDGKDFNPNMFSRDFDTYLNKEAELYLDEIGVDGVLRDGIKKFVMSIRQMDAPFDSTEFRAIDQRFQDSIIDFYERTTNDEAFRYSSNITNNFRIAGDEDPKEFLIRTAKTIHSNIYEGASSSKITDTYEENVDTILDKFEERFKTRPGQVAYLLDLYTVYQPDLDQLMSAMKSKNNEKKLLALFPTMGDYQKRTLLYLFGDEYSETN